MLIRWIKSKDQVLFFSLFMTFFFIIGSACRLFAPSTLAETTPTEILPELEISTPTPEASPTSPLPTATDEMITQHRQWAVSAADQKGSDEAAFALGEPDSEGCELNPWESVWVYQSDSFPSASNYLQLFFAEPVLPTQVNIHLAYTHAAITKVSLIDLQGQPHVIYEDAPMDLDDCPTILSIQAEDVSRPVYAVRIDVTTVGEEISKLTAIDAVELVGEPLAEAQATPIPTPYLTMSSLGFNASDVQEGFVHFEVFDNNIDEKISITECDAFSYNVTDTERTLRFFSCEDSTEIWLYVPPALEIGSIPLNSYPTFPSAKLLFEGNTIPAMEGELWIDQISDTHLTGVLEFKGFDSENQVDYYRVVAVFNQIPLTEEAAQKPGDMILQWGQAAAASSEWSSDENAAAQADGPSDTWENCETALTTWKPAADDPQPWLEITFETPVSPTVLNILYSGSEGSISAVNLLSAADFFPLDLATSRVLEGCPKALVFDTFNLPPIDILGVQILMDPEALNQDFGIDAVQLIGVIGE